MEGPAGPKGVGTVKTHPLPRVPRGVHGPVGLKKAPAKAAPRATTVAKKSGPGLFASAAKGTQAALTSPSATPGDGSSGAVDLNSILSGLGLGQGQLNSLLSQMGGTPISIANSKGQPTDIGKLINSMSTPYGPNLGSQIAAAQYDPIIQGLQVQQQVQTRQAAQNMADIQNWYGQVAKAAQDAIAGDASVMQGAATSDQNIASALAGSIGGSANPGAASVAKQGADNAAFTNAINASQSQYDNMVPALLKEDQAGVSQRESAMNQQAALSLALQLSQNQGLEKSTALQLQNQFDQQNKALDAQKLQTLMGIKQYNSGLKSQKAQQQLSTKLALAQMAEAAPSLGLKTALTQAQIAKTYAGIQQGNYRLKQADIRLIQNGQKIALEKGMDSARYKQIQSQVLKNLNSLNPKNAKNPALSVDLVTAANNAAGLMGIGSDRRLVKGSGGPAKLATVIGSILRGRKLAPGSPEYRQIAYTLMSGFRLSDGRPIHIPNNWFTGR